MFETVIVDGSPLPASGALVFAHDTKRIEFDYTAIGYRRAGDIEFRSYLEGFDEQWSERGTRRTVSYTSLPPGDYVMRIGARYHDAAWPDSSASLAFTIPPAFLDRWSVRLILAASLAGAAFGFVKRRECRIRAVAEREREVRTRISELESRALRSQINPHFMFNSLNGIREAVLGGRTKVASDYLDKFSLLMRNILEHSDRATVSLEREIETIRLYVELEQLRFEEPFRFTIEVTESLDAASVAIPPMLIQPVVENAIWHGLGTKRGDKLLSISFSGDERRITCRVEDNGVGRSAAVVRKARMPGDRRARGMQITRDLLEALRASTGDGAGIDVVDLFNADGSAAGTRVTLTIPTQP
jgi:two-component sensor histidine kinase